MELLLLFLLPFQLGTYFFFDFSFVNGVRVDYLAPALFLTDIVAVGIIVHRRKIIIEHLQKLVSWVLVFGFLFTAQMLIAQEPFLVLYWMVKFIEMYVLYVVFSGLKLSTLRVVGVLTAGAGLQLFLVAAQFIKKGSLQGVFYYLGERYMSLTTPGIAKASFLDQQILRPYGTFSHPNSLAGFYLLLFAVSLVVFANNKPGGLVRRTALLLASMSVVLVFLSFAKIAIITLLMSTVLFAIMYRDNLISQCKLCTIAKGGILLVLAFVFLQAQSDPLSLEKRVFLLHQGVDIVTKYPILGTGFGNHLYSQATYPSPYPFFFLQPVHNIFILFLMQAGVVICGLVAYRIVKFLRSQPLRMFALPLFVVISTGMFDHYWLTLQQNILLIPVIFGLLAGFKKSSSSQ